MSYAKEEDIFQDEFLLVWQQYKFMSHVEIEFFPF